MPRRVRRRRRVRKKRRNGNGLFRFVSNNPVPPQKLVRLKYVEQITLNPPITSMDHFLINANNIRDPNRTGVGHKPLGSEQWDPFYNLYTVIRADIRVTFHSATSTNLASGIVGIYLNDDVNSTDVMDTMIEYERQNHAHLGPFNGNDGIVTVRQSYTPMKMFHRPVKSYIGSTSGKGTMLATPDPVDLAVFDIFAGPIVSASDMAPVDVLIEVWYTTMLTDRETLPGS